MDAGENNFPVILPDEIFTPSQNVLEGQTAACAAGKRDNAVAAKCVAAVLNFEKSPGPTRPG